MATNKVIYGNDTLIDLTGDTVTASDVAQGVTFHTKAGVQTTGTLVPAQSLTNEQMTALRTLIQG